jgi:hypothetical protein
MKKSYLLFVTLGVLALAVTPIAKANSVTLNQDAYSFSVGGEFSAVTSPSFLNNYVASTIVNGGFETFCIETTVEFTPGTSYNFTLSSVDSLGRNLTEGAAFLYYDFAKGILTGYNYNNPATRLTEAGQLQAAIWWLQGNQTYSGYPNGATGNPFYDLAVSTLGLANVTKANNGLYGVDVLQLTDATGKSAQNQLVVVSDSSMTIGLLGMGLLGMYIVQFKFRKSSRAPALIRIR